jgi:hypothetical protein
MIQYFIFLNISKIDDIMKIFKMCTNGWKHLNDIFYYIFDGLTAIEYDRRTKQRTKKNFFSDS